MQRDDHYPDDYDPDLPKSRPTSRRNSASHSRRSSVQKDKEGKKKSPLSSSPSSSNSTPKKVVKPLDFMVTGRQILKKSDRANSLPGSYHRRPSAESLITKSKRSLDIKRQPPTSQSSKSQETSLEDEMSLDLSQISDLEETNSKHGKSKFSALATSTPKGIPKNFQKNRSSSLHNQMLQKMDLGRVSSKKIDKEKKRDDTFTYSRDSWYKTSSSASNYRYGANTELDYSSVSPEYSGQSSSELSPKCSTREPDLISPRSQELQVSSCCLSSFQDCSEVDTKVEDYRLDNGEWAHFWANYNSVAKVPIKGYYDQCPTPYKTENIDLTDLEFSTEESRKRSPDNSKNVNSIIRNEGLHLTPRETQNIIKCAHILGNVLSKAIERRSKEKDDAKVQEVGADDFEPETSEPANNLKGVKKKSLTLDLKETALPEQVEEETKEVMIQTDISLPNTKSAPKIFEKILRQLSRNSLEECLEKKKEVGNNKEAEKEQKISEAN